MTLKFAMIVGSEDFGSGRGEVDGLSPQTSVLAPGEGEQRPEQPFLPLTGGGNLRAHLPQGGRVCVGVGERELGERELEGDLAAQLMSGVADEAPFRFEEVPGCGRRRVPAAERARGSLCACGQRVLAVAGVGPDRRRSPVAAGPI